MAGLVLDCSVAVSWLMPDEGKAEKILEWVVAEGALVPSLWFLEVGNVLLASVRKKRMTHAQRHEALCALGRLPIQVDGSSIREVMAASMALADSYNLTLYDATYLELAIRRSLPLVTFDSALKQAGELAGLRTSFFEREV